MLHKRTKTTDLNKHLSRKNMELIVLEKEENVLTFKDIVTGKILRALLKDNYLLINKDALSLANSKNTFSYSYRPKEKGKVMTSKLLKQIIASKKIFSKENYDPEAVKEFNEKTGQNISSEFRFTVNGEGSFLVTVEEDYDKTAVKDMSLEEQVDLLKSFFKDAPKPL